MSSTMRDTYTSFGELLRYLRERARLTQRALGKAVGYTGAHITRLEKGLRRPDPVVVRARFIDVLDLQDEPALAEQLIALAAVGVQQTPEAPQNPTAQNAPAVPPRRTNPHRAVSLPAQLTSFIGREREMAEVTRLLGPGGARLVTLTGAGGAGKTRLAIEVGWAVAPDGVWLVELAALSDPAGVPRAVKDALHLPDELGRSPADVLIDYLAPRRLLLLLDNCEHLIGACAELVEALLSACPDLSILATSREALQCPGEVVWRVPPLTTPGPEPQLPLEQVAAFEAVQLFAARAACAQPDFKVTHANATAVARICARLDGLPLAIEMAAARTAAMSTQEIAARLDDRFALLTTGRCGALPHQSTLRATMEWSYNLLTEPERVLLARLSVFADGCTAELAQVVCGEDILPLLVSLVGKSLVVADTREEHTRYRLLETVRQFASEKLAQRSEGDLLYRRLAAYVTQPPIVEGGFYAPEWWRMLVAEVGNIRNLIVWARSQPDCADIVIRVACTFGYFSANCGSVAEPLAWLEEGLATERGISIRLRAMGLTGKLLLLMYAGYNMGRWSADAEELAMLVDELRTDLEKFTALLLLGLADVGRTDLDAAERTFERMQAFSRQASFRFGIGVSLFHQVLVRVARGDQAGAARLLRQAYELGMDPDFEGVLIVRLAGTVWVDAAQALAQIESELSLWRNDESYGHLWTGHRALIGRALQLRVQGLLLSGDYEQAEACARESLDLFRDLDLAWSEGFGIAEALLELGRIAWLRGDPGAARAYGEQCLELYLRAGDMEHAAQAHTLVGYAALGQGDLDGAAISLRRGLALFSELDQPAGIVVALAGQAALAEARGDAECAARLYGAADAPPQSLLLWLSWALPSLRLASRIIYDRAMVAARQRYAGAPYAAAWAQGRTMTLEQAVDTARALSDRWAFGKAVTNSRAGE